ncbi:S8 family peptidase [Thalassotalea agarivorans]|uniref:Subtilisin n=1 Tax=Thalassotalea agarivorans TaxID=349064 RepID=A0A1I0G8N4_THASX|nr:S8 family serine peptidase [Thalassotalea agarivorans]SET66320.1 subtilisin [Thalassotalea agarivorans]
MNNKIIKTFGALVAMIASMNVYAGKEDQKLDIIVKLDPALSVSGHQNNKANAKNIANGMGIGSVKHSYGSAYFGFAASVTAGKLASLQKNSKVLAIEFDAEKHINKGKPGGGGSTPQPQQVPWGIDRVGADQNTNQGDGVHVYILDTGLDSDHQDLAANIGNGMAFERCKGKSCNMPWDDDHGHGTHVGGTVAALDNDIDVVGVAPQVTLHAAKICTSRGSCPNSSTIAALDWVTSEITSRGSAAVVNMSIGGSGGVSGSCTNAGFTGNDAYHEALCNARNAGAVIVVAAGNEGSNAINYTPAAYADTVITVSSTKEGDDWNSFSNWGNQQAPWTTNSSAPVAIAAPGGSVLSLRVGGGTTVSSGTSMASPHVAGAAALILSSSTQSNDGTAFENVRAILLQTAESTNSFSNTTGDPHTEDFLDASNL